MLRNKFQKNISPGQTSLGGFFFAILFWRMEKKLKHNKKEKIPLRTVWDFSQVLKGDADPKLKKLRLEVKKKTNDFVNKWGNRRDYLKNPNVLFEALNDYEVWNREFGAHGREVYYYYLRFEQDQESVHLKASYQQAVEKAKYIGNEIRFFPLRLAQVDLETQKKFLSYPPLAGYKHYLEKIFAEAKFTLSEKEENILSLMETPAYENWIMMTESSLTKETAVLKYIFPQKRISFSELLNLVNNKDKKVRDEAHQTIICILESKAEMATAEMNAILLYKKTEDKLRGFSRPDAGRHLSDDIDTETVDALIKAVTKNFSVVHKYYAFKSRLLKVKKLGYHERNLSYGTTDKKYSYKKAFSLVKKSFQNIDPEFSSILEDFNAKGRIDVFPKKGKSSGAFCAHSIPKLPTYILLNHTNRLHDVLTLAHEAGHGVNNELMRAKQNVLNCDTSLAIAEVASTFMEDFVLQTLSEEAQLETRLALMMAKLDDDIATIFRQTAAYNFEKELHSNFRIKGYLSKKEIDELFLKHMKSYLGSSIVMNKGDENWWIYWSHFRNFFYVYSYVSGLLISKALQAEVKKDKKFIFQVKEILSAGTSQSPKDLFMSVGLDISKSSFWEKGIKEIVNLLTEAEALAKSLKKI